jgi:hypothetical protein
MKFNELFFFSIIILVILLFVIVFDMIPENWKSKFTHAVPFFTSVAIVAGVLRYTYTSQQEIERIANESTMSAIRANIDQWGKIVEIFKNQPGLRALYQEMHTWELYEASPTAERDRDRDFEFSACQEVLLLIGTIFALMQETEFIQGADKVFPAMMEAWKLRVAMMFQSPTLKKWWYARRWQHSEAMNKWVEERIRTPRPDFTLPSFTEELLRLSHTYEMPADWKPDWVSKLKNTKSSKK